MDKYHYNHIVKLTSIIFVAIIVFIIIFNQDFLWRVVGVGILIVAIYLLLRAFIESFTVYEDKLVLQKPFYSIYVYWKDIGLISAIEYRDNNYNIYLSSLKGIEDSNFKKSILINWQYNDHKELVKKILTYCEKNENTYIDKKVYKAIGD